jgi:DNA-binding NarL/FixJ family response regulator
MGATVLVVDDRREFRALARALLEADGFAVVGEAADGKEALDVVRALRPDVVLLDVRLPDGSGVEVARTLRRLHPIPLVVLTSSGDYGYAVAECGAAGFIPKNGLSGAALRAVIEVV